MNIVAYAVFDVETGDVVHVHVEPVEIDSSKEEILRMVDVSRTRQLDAVRLPGDELPVGQARVVEGQLRAADGENSAMAGIGGWAVEPRAERQYLPQPAADARRGTG